VFIKTRSSSLALNVTYRQTVLSLKCELEKMTGVLRQDQCLMYGSEALKDGLTLFGWIISFPPNQPLTGCLLDRLSNIGWVYYPTYSGFGGRRRTRQEVGGG
jgi:hypothetical protein